VEGQLTSLDVAADQQVMAGDAMAIQAQAYQRSPLEPLPAERISQRRSCFSSALTASAQAAPATDEQRSQVGAYPGSLRQPFSPPLLRSLSGPVMVAMRPWPS
jgi:hypothetical protein